jgi:hypothetical protein
MGDVLSQIATICGIGVVTCCAFGVGLFFLAVFTGRGLIIPTVVSLVPQLFGNVTDFVGGMFGGGDGRGGRSDARYVTDEEGEVVDRRTGQRLRPQDRIDRIKRRFEDTGSDIGPSRAGAPDEREPRPSAPGRRPATDFDNFDTDDDGPPQRRIGNRDARDSRRREWNEDELFGGMLDDNGDGYPDY